LPGAIPQALPYAAAEVRIARGAVPTTLAGATAGGPTWELANERFLLRIPLLVRIQIASGCEIVTEAENGTADHEIACFVLGVAFGILLHQRGALVLHGAAVAKGDRAIAICGASGSGKSTLAAALCRNCCALVADDICVIGQDALRRPVVFPEGRQLKLWQESIDRLDLRQFRRGAVRKSLEKYYVDPRETVAKPPLLSAIYLLREARASLKPGIQSLGLPDAMRLLDNQGYRPALHEMFGHKARLLARGAAALGHAEAFLVVRPRGFEELPRTVEELTAHWDTLQR
jgi:hypothetical protein